VARPITNGTIRLTWEDTAENEDGTVVQVSSDGTNWAALGEVACNITVFESSLAAPDQPYYFRVRATNDVGVSEWSNRARGVALGPFALRLDRLDETRVVLSFNAVAGQSYTLQTRGNLNSGSWSNLTSFATTTNATVRFTNSSAGAESYFRLTAP